MRYHPVKAIIALLSVVIFLCLAFLPAAEAHRTRRYQPHHESVWDDLHHCESTHGLGSPNEFQFNLRTWRSMPERAGRPETHTYAEQLQSAQDAVARGGWRSQFPGCYRAMRAFHHLP